MVFKRLPLVLPLLAGLAAMPAAQAQMDVLPEIRAGIMSHDVGNGSAGLFDATRIQDANVELLFKLPALDAWVLGELRPHLGATIHMGGAESLLYAGVSYTVPLPVLPMFAEASVGGALHGGPLVAAATPSRFGCTALARASASLGVNVLAGVAAMATIEHYTDFGACAMPDNGETNVGVRLGFRF